MGPIRGHAGLGARKRYGKRQNGGKKSLDYLIKHEPRRTKVLWKQRTVKSGHCQIQDRGLLQAEFALWLSKVRTQIV